MTAQDSRADGNASAEDNRSASTTTMQPRRQFDVLPPPRQPVFRAHTHKQSLPIATPCPPAALVREDSNTSFIAAGGTGGRSINRGNAENHSPLNPDRLRLDRTTVISLLTDDEEEAEEEEEAAAAAAAATYVQVPTSRHYSRGKPLYKFSNPLQFAPPPARSPAALPAALLPPYLLDPRTGQWYVMMPQARLEEASYYGPAPMVLAPVRNQKRHTGARGSPVIHHFESQIPPTTSYGHPPQLPQRQVTVQSAAQPTMPAESYMKQKVGGTSKINRNWEVTALSSSYDVVVTDTHVAAPSTPADTEDAASRSSRAATRPISGEACKSSAVSTKGCHERAVEVPKTRFSGHDCGISGVAKTESKPHKSRPASPASSVEEDDRLLKILSKILKERNGPAETAPVTTSALFKHDNVDKTISPSTLVSMPVKRRAKRGRGRRPRTSACVVSVPSMSHTSHAAGLTSPTSRSSTSTHTGKVSKPLVRTPTNGLHDVADTESDTIIVAANLLHPTSAITSKTTSAPPSDTIKLKLTFSGNKVQSEDKHRADRAAASRNHLVKSKGVTGNAYVGLENVRGADCGDLDHNISAKDDERPTKLRKTLTTRYTDSNNQNTKCNESATSSGPNSPLTELSDTIPYEDVEMIGAQ